MRASLLVVAAIASMSSCLGAAAAGLGVNQLTLGDDFRQMSQAAGAASCTDRKATRKALECRGAASGLKPGFDTVAGAPIRHLTLDAFADTRKLEGISISFNANDFDAVRASFAERYPTLKCAESSLQDKSGTKLSQTECTATLPEGRIRMERRAESMEISTLEIATPAWQAVSDAED
jgi:hypothetical protein